jgi:hypothetical protein
MAFSLTVPNPVTSPRMRPVADDPFGCPSLSEDLNEKPNFTFALISDPQFDRETNRATLIKKAEATIRDLNQLNPAFVLVAGDLVNNNLPEEWKMFNEIFAKLKPPKHIVPGNHDVLFNYKLIEDSYSTASEKKPEYAKIVKQALADAAKEGFTGPAAFYEKYTGAKPRQLIEHGDCAFITVPFLTMRSRSIFCKSNLNDPKISGTCSYSLTIPRCRRLETTSCLSLAVRKFCHFCTSTE